MSAPTSEPARRIATIMHRGLETAWADKEVRQFRALVKSGCFKTLDDLALMERYCESERKKGDKGIHRRDLYTLLNNWQSELDRARAWEARNPRQNAFKRARAEMQRPEPSDAHRVKCYEFFKGLSDQLKTKFTAPVLMSGAEIEARKAGLREVET